MSWNNAYRRKQCEEKQKKQAEEYRALGMTEEQIKAMYEFDLEQFKSDRRFYSHTQPFATSDFLEGEEDESESTLLLKFFNELTVTIDNCGEKSRYWWVEEINNPQLYKIVISLPKESVELFTLIYVDKLNQSEISKIFNISQAAISQRLKKINEIFVICL